MDIQKELQEKIGRIRDINTQLGEISKKIGALQEEGRAIQSKGLELKGAIDFLLELEAKEKEASRLTLPEKGLILPPGVKCSATEAQIKNALDLVGLAETKAPSDQGLDTPPVAPTLDAPLETAEGTLNQNGGN